MAGEHPRPPSPVLIEDPEAAGRRLQQLVDRLAARRRIPHAVVAVEAGDGSFRWIGAAGAADGEGAPMTPDTPYLVASVTKLYIGTLVLQLHEEGRVDLDAPAMEYVPGIEGLHVRRGVDHTPRVTVRHLLSHTSGLPDHLEDHPRRQPSLYRRISRGEDVALDFDDVVRIVRDELQPRFPPSDLSAGRQRARYSDTGFQVLIALVEQVCGERFGPLLTHRILEPLGLRRTWLPGRTEPAEPTGEPAALWARGRPLSVPRALASFNDLYSTASDQLAFGRALVRGDVFADPATYRLMHERWNRIVFGLRYGLATMKFRINRFFGPGRRPATLIGHSGATGSWLLHCPELDVIVAGTVDEAGARAVPYRFVPGVLRVLRP